MGNWTELRSENGRLLARLDTERRLLELVRNGEHTLVDLDRFIVLDRTVLVEQSEQADATLPPARPGPTEVKC